jgi:hypothetical protein
MDALTRDLFAQRSGARVYGYSLDPDAPLNKLEDASLRIYCAHIQAGTPCENVYDMMYRSVEEAKHLLEIAQY